MSTKSQPIRRQATPGFQDNTMIDAAEVVITPVRRAERVPAGAALRFALSPDDCYEYRVFTRIKFMRTGKYALVIRAGDVVLRSSHLLHPDGYWHAERCETVPLEWSEIFGPLLPEFEIVVERIGDLDGRR